MKNTEQAAKKYVAKVYKPKANNTYKKNTKDSYCLRIWFKGAEAEQVKGFLEAIRENGTNRVSTKFVRDSILSSIGNIK